MNERNLRKIERALLRAAADIDDYRAGLTPERIDRLRSHRDLMLNLVGTLGASVRRIELCVAALRASRRGKL